MLDILSTMLFNRDTNKANVTLLN